MRESHVFDIPVTDDSATSLKAIPFITILHQLHPSSPLQTPLILCLYTCQTHAHTHRHTSGKMVVPPTQTCTFTDKKERTHYHEQHSCVLLLC